MKSLVYKLGLAVLAIFAPIQGILVSTMTLIACDLISGVWASQKRGDKINSSGFRRTIVKLVVYESAIALGFIAQHYLLMDAIPVCNIVGSYVGITELTSAYENINEISGGQLLKAILDKLGSENKP